MLSDVAKAVGQMHALVRRRPLSDRQSRPPFVRGPDRTRHKTAAAARAHIVQLVLDAIRAERALKGTDSRFRRVRRQVLVAIFAVRPKLQRHGCLSILIRRGSSQIGRRKRMPYFPQFRPFPRHSGMRHLAQARNPYSRSWLWIPGSRVTRPGMTKVLILPRQLLQRQLCAFLQPVQHDRRAHMRHALMRHQHVVDDVGQALEVAQHDLQQVVGIAGE